MTESTSLILSRKNQYRGINAHLNSRLQTEGWEAFHTNHISDLYAYLNKKLRGTGYVARLEDSLQIRREYTPPRRPEADVLIRDTDLARSTQGPARFPSGAMVLYHQGAVAIAADPSRYRDVDYFKAISIHRLDIPEGHDFPVAWIELLSPSNKSGGGHYRDYQEKREALLETETCVLVEIDYLHESPSTILGYPDYTRQDGGSTAYRVIVVDTRGKGIVRGDLYIAAFGVDEPIPVIPIPLHGADVVSLDLGEVYNQTYTRIEYGINDDTRVDYRHLPARIERYSQADRRRIMQRIVAVEMAHEEGVDIETGDEPLPIDPVRIDARMRAREEQAGLHPPEMRTE
ncbi:MAG: DUF4058 family protein [Anaerolineae bacterium]|nr:DUF4058 family protein [Anaerolineae bacterium]